MNSEMELEAPRICHKCGGTQLRPHACRATGCIWRVCEQCSAVSTFWWQKTHFTNPDGSVRFERTPHWLGRAA